MERELASLQRSSDDSGIAAAYRMVLLATAVGIPVFFVPRIMLGPYSVPKLALLIGGLSIALGLVIVDWSRGRTHSFKRLAVPATALVLPLTIAWLWSPYREWALFGDYSRLNGLVPYALVALFGIVIADAFAGRPYLLALGLAVAGGLVGTYVLLQSLGLDPYWSPGEVGPSEYPPSTIGHFNFVGGFLGICLPLSLYTWIKGPCHRMWGAWSTIGVSVGLLLANSQGGWAAGLAGASIVVGSLLGERYGSARRVGFFAAALVGCLVVGTVLASSLFPDQGGLATTEQRKQLWTTALEMGADSPLVGRGPGSYSVEGVRYRSLASVLAESATPDEPHSVPLSFWANAGAVGAIGFLVFAAWIIRAGLRTPPRDHLAVAFFAACVAYLVQSLGSIDQLPLRSILWVALAGLVVSTEPEAPRIHPSDPKPRIIRILSGVPVALIIAAFGLYYAGGLLLAEYRAESGREHFSAGDLAEAIVDFERAISFRFEPHYLNLYGQQLGLAALDEGASADQLIRRVRSLYRYLEDVPEISGIMGEAIVFHHWGRFDPSADIEAERLLRRAETLDPENPVIDVLLSEVLIDLGLTRQARETLEAWVPSLENHLPTYWGALSIARLLDGDPAAAAQALAEGLSQDPFECRVRIAEEFIRHRKEPSLPVTIPITLTLRAICGEGGYQFFLTHLPERQTS